MYTFQCHAKCQVDETVEGSALLMSATLASLNQRSKFRMHIFKSYLGPDWYIRLNVCTDWSDTAHVGYKLRYERINQTQRCEDNRKKIMAEVSGHCFKQSWKEADITGGDAQHIGIRLQARSLIIKLGSNPCLLLNSSCLVHWLECNGTGCSELESLTFDRCTYLSICVFHWSYDDRCRTT